MRGRSFQRELSLAQYSHRACRPIHFEHAAIRDSVCGIGDRYHTRDAELTRYNDGVAHKGSDIDHPPSGRQEQRRPGRIGQRHDQDVSRLKPLRVGRIEYDTGAAPHDARRTAIALEYLPGGSRLGLDCLTSFNLLDARYIVLRRYKEWRCHGSKSLAQRPAFPNDWNETAGIARILWQLVVKSKHRHHARIVDAALGGGAPYQFAKDPLPRCAHAYRPVAGRLAGARPVRQRLDSLF